MFGLDHTLTNFNFIKTYILCYNKRLVKVNKHINNVFHCLLTF